jgi:hypothetical protein
MGLSLCRLAGLAVLLVAHVASSSSHAAGFDTRASHAIIVDVVTGSTLSRRRRMNRSSRRASRSS